VNFLCWLGIHRWGKWGAPQPLTLYTDYGTYRLQGQQTFCLRCGKQKQRTI
jgi:hypothetical protein